MDLVTDAVDAAALAADAVTEIQSAILSDATPIQGARIDAAISSRAVAGDAMDLITDALDASSLANSAADKISDQVWDEPIAAHSSAGSTGLELANKTEGGEAMTLTVGERNAIADQVWNESLVLHLTPGSTGKALDDAGATVDPAVVASAVWDEPLATHNLPGSAGEAQTEAATATSAAEKIDTIPTDWPPTPGSLLDRLANKDGGQTYDQSRDSLEGIRDIIGP
jgi:flagellar capping protein FliD